MFKAKTVHPKKVFIDFKTLTKSELNALSENWERDARVFEAKLQGYSQNALANEEKVERLWEVGRKLWKRVALLERWRLRNP